MKKRIALILLSLVLLAGCSQGRKAQAILLPAKEDVISILAVHGEQAATSIDEAWIGEVMTLLADVKATNKESNYDAPRVDDYWDIHMTCADGTVKTVFFYEEKGEEYVEQPYQGIYKPSSELGEKLRALMASLDR